jgi:hypothetical protein
VLEQVDVVIKGGLPFKLPAVLQAPAHSK